MHRPVNRRHRRDLDDNVIVSLVQWWHRGEQAGDNVRPVNDRVAARWAVRNGGDVRCCGSDDEDRRETRKVVTTANGTLVIGSGTRTAASTNHRGSPAI